MPIGAESDNRGCWRRIVKTSRRIPIEIDRSLDPDPIFTRVRPTLANRSCGVLIGEGTTTTRQLPSAPCSERTDPSGGSGAGQSALVGDSLNDEQRSNDLSIPSSRETTRPKIRDVREHEPESQ